MLIAQRVERGNVNEIRIKTPELIEIETGRTPNELLVKEVWLQNFDFCL